MGRPFYSSEVAFFTNDALGINMAVNGSVSNKIFRLDAPTDTTFSVSAIKFGFHAPWSNSGIEEANKFMDSTALTNGILIQDYHDNTLVFESNIKTNYDLLALPVSNWRKPIIGVSNVVVEIYFDFSESPIIINNATNDYNQITIQDNLSFLTNFRASARGEIKLT
jgi:hypothetical protein